MTDKITKQEIEQFKTQILMAQTQQEKAQILEQLASKIQLAESTEEDSSPSGGAGPVPAG